MSYSLIIPTMSYSWTFKLCLDSLVQSDFPGQILVVEEGNSQREICKDYLPKSIIYLKSDQFLGPDNLVELGLTAAKGDYILYSHNDVIFFPTWFTEFENLLKQIPHEYLGMLNVAYDQVLINTELKNLEELRSSISDQNTVFKTKLYGASDIGLANDLWSDNRVARMSVLSCFSRELCDQLVPFVGGMGFDWEIHLHCAKENKLNLTALLSQPVIHLNREYGFGTDTQNYKQKYLDLRDEAYRSFQERYNMDVNTFFDHYFGQVQFNFREEISELLDQHDYKGATGFIESLMYGN